jgi:dipeptidyl aminopeptidase/acylaminoacyl peptidase
VRRLSVPTPQRCGRDSEQFPQRLADGALAFVQYCLGRPGSSAGRSVRLVRFVEGTRSLTRIVPYSLPYFVASFTIRADGRGLINDGRGLSERLQWLTPTGLRPLRLGWARAGQPAWSSDGRWVAVAGVSAPDSPTSPSAKWSLYLLRSDGRIARRLVDGLRDPGRPAWSPDGRWIAITLTWVDGVRGIYIVDVRDGSVHLVKAGAAYGNVTWLTGSRSIVAAVGRHPRRSGNARVGLEEIRLDGLRR